MVPLMCCPVGLLGSFSVQCSCWCVSLSSWFCCAPHCALAGGPCWSCFVVRLLFGFSFCSWLLSLPPRFVLFGALVQFVLRFAGTSLWVSGCSCDGSVALLSCWECSCALSSFRHLSHGSKGLLPCVGFSPSTPCCR